MFKYLKFRDSVIFSLEYHAVAFMLRVLQKPHLVL